MKLQVAHEGQLVAMSGLFPTLRLKLVHFQELAQKSFHFLNIVTKNFKLIAK